MNARAMTWVGIALIAVVGAGVVYLLYDQAETHQRELAAAAASKGPWGEAADFLDSIVASDVFETIAATWAA